MSEPQGEIPSECRIAGHIYREVRSDATHVTARCIRCPKEKRFSLAKWADREVNILLHWLGG